MPSGRAVVSSRSSEFEDWRQRSVRRDRLLPLAADLDLFAPAADPSLLPLCTLHSHRCRATGCQLRTPPQCRAPGFQPRRPGPPGAAAVEAVPAAAPLLEKQQNGDGGPVVRFGFPKGSLQKSTEDLFARAGYQVGAMGRRPTGERGKEYHSPCCSHTLDATCCLLCLLASFGQHAATSPEPTCALAAASLPQVKISERGYFPKVNDEGLSMVLFRSQEIRWVLVSHCVTMVGG